MDTWMERGVLDLSLLGPQTTQRKFPRPQVHPLVDTGELQRWESWFPQALQRSRVHVGQGKRGNQPLLDTSVPKSGHCLGLSYISAHLILLATLRDVHHCHHFLDEKPDPP